MNVMKEANELSRVQEPNLKGLSLGERIGDLLRSMRPKQWTKNLLVFMPIIFGGKLLDAKLLEATAICAVAFCFGSSAIYLFNDVLDRKRDRVHPTKSRRPIASGRISVTTACAMSLLLATVALTITFCLRPFLMVIMLSYLVLMFFYSLSLKHYALIDVMVVALGFVLRAVAGAFTVSIPLSGWFLLGTIFGALFLALERRRHELFRLEQGAAEHRSVLNIYSENLLDRIESLVLPTLFVCYIFYSFLSIHGQWMMITVPFVFYGLTRYQLLSVQGRDTGSPEDVLLKDAPIQITVVLWLLTVIGVIYGYIPHFFGSLVQGIDSGTLFR
jgi:4-hydroxybenzoate polyprenyltransferase